MRVYFLAEQPCALTIGGTYLGLVDGFERSVELSPQDAHFCELAPCGYQPVRFRLDETFLREPPEHISLYYTEGAVAVYASGFLRADGALHVVWQERLRNDRLTLCVMGRVQLHLENETGFHIIDLPDAFANCGVKALPDGYLLTGEDVFAILMRDGKVAALSDGKVLDAGETVKAEIPFHDSRGHTAVCEWRAGELVSCALRSTREPSAATWALALFESALIGADCTPYLAPALQDKAGSLREFLGDFQSVVLTEEENKVGLAFKRQERVYDVRYFRVETEDGKVKNIIPL